MKERIIEFLKAENKTSAQLAEEIGVQPSGISHILSGRNKPSLDFILKMLEKYHFLSTEWLLFGKGKMYREPEMQGLFEDSESQGMKPEIDEKPLALSFEAPEKVQESSIQEEKGKSIVEKIVWFYNNKTFMEYYPGKERDKK